MCNEAPPQEGWQELRQVPLQIQAPPPQVLRGVGRLAVEAGVKDIFVSGSQFPEGQFDDAGRHFAHAEFQQQDVFARLFQQPAAKKGVVAIYLRLPRTPLQKGIVPHPGRQHPPTVRAARNSLVRQMHTLQPIRQFLHHLPILPNIVPAGLAALAVAKVTLKGADLFRGKHPEKLPIHIGRQHKGRLVRHKRPQVQIGLACGSVPYKTDVLAVIPPLLLIAGNTRQS